MLIDVIWALVYCTTLWYLCTSHHLIGVPGTSALSLIFLFVFPFPLFFIIFTWSTRPIHLRTMWTNALLNFLCKCQCEQIKNSFSLAHLLSIFVRCSWFDWVVCRRHKTNKYSSVGSFSIHRIHRFILGYTMYSVRVVFDRKRKLTAVSPFLLLSTKSEPHTCSRDVHKISRKI